MIYKYDGVAYRVGYQGDECLDQDVRLKTLKSRRTVQLPQVTLAALTVHKSRQSQERELAGSAWRTPVLVVDGEPAGVTDLVFVNGAGNPYEAPTVTHLFQALLKSAGIKHHRFMICGTLPPRCSPCREFTSDAIQGALGWENIAMLNRYGHFIEESRRAVASAMDAILAPVAVNVAVNETDSKVN